MTAWRHRSFLGGFGLLIMDIVFYGVLGQVHGLKRCGGFVMGVEIGLLCAVLALVLSLFGKGWRRWAVVLAAIVASYFWFSWLAWLAQMEC